MMLVNHYCSQIGAIISARMVHLCDHCLKWFVGFTSSSSDQRQHYLQPAAAPPLLWTFRIPQGSSLLYWTPRLRCPAASPYRRQAQQLTDDTAVAETVSFIAPPCTCGDATSTTTASITPCCGKHCADMRRNDLGRLFL
jgi:hypothetical protein